jgi:ABC-type glycerol-3-phosphate transport system permease component
VLIVVAILPIIAMLPFFQERLEQGVIVGGIKG